MSGRIKVEICVGDLTSALEAGAGGADRVELCDNLAVGGTTPGPGTIAEACRRLTIPVHVLIRPRGGDFLHNEPERAAMRHDIEAAKRLGAAGVVFGLLQTDGRIDREQTEALVALARPLSITFHKAFDQTPDQEEALATLISLGIDRVLTSGGCPTALEGIENLARLVIQARNQIGILVGGSLSLDNLETIVARTGAREVHLGSSACRTMHSPMTHVPRDGSEVTWPSVDAKQVRAIVDHVKKIQSRDHDLF